MPDPSPVFVHLHVAKCAGSSINRVLRDRFGERSVTHPDTERLKRYDTLDNAGRDAELDCVTGHFQWGWHRRFNRKVIYFSVLRNPLERICSMFNFVHRRTQHPGHERLRRHLLDLNEITPEWLERFPGFNWQFTNQFCRVYNDGDLTEATYPALEARVLSWMRAERFVVGDLDTIRQFMRAQGLLAEGKDLPRRNETSKYSVRHEYTHASPEMLSESTRQFLLERNRLDLRLLEAIAAQNRALGLESGPAPYVIAGASEKLSAA